MNVDARTDPLSLTDTYLNLNIMEQNERFAGFTALHLATLTKNARAVRLLVDAGSKQYRLEKEHIDSCVKPQSMGHPMMDELDTFEELFDEDWIGSESVHTASSTGDSTELDEDEEEEGVIDEGAREGQGG